MLSVILSLVGVAVLVVIDQLIKASVVNNLPYHESVPAIDGLLNWTYTTNSGGGFSILSGKTVFLLLATSLFLAFMLYLYFKGWLKHWLGRASVLLMVAGGIGNMIDRLFNGGKVVDYIDISPIFNFPIFNFADCCVSVGGMLFCIYILFLHDRAADKADAKPEGTAAIEE